MRETYGRRPGAAHGLLYGRRNLQTRTMAITKTPQPARPAMDEWGVYDPQQAGLAALFARLDRPVKPVVDDRPKAIEKCAVPGRPSLGDAK